MNRRDLLLEESPEADIPVEEEHKLRKSVEEGSMYLALISTPGWKHLMKNWVDKHLATERFFTAPKEELSEVRAAQKELSDLLRYVAGQVEAGQRAFERLQK